MGVFCLGTLGVKIHSAAGLRPLDKEGEKVSGFFSSPEVAVYGLFMVPDRRHGGGGTASHPSKNQTSNPEEVATFNAIHGKRFLILFNFPPNSPSLGFYFALSAVSYIPMSKTAFKLPNLFDEPFQLPSGCPGHQCSHRSAPARPELEGVEAMALLGGKLLITLSEESPPPARSPGVGVRGSVPSPSTRASNNPAK